MSTAACPDCKFWNELALSRGQRINELECQLIDQHRLYAEAVAAGDAAWRHHIPNLTRRALAFERLPAFARRLLLRGVPA